MMTPEEAIDYINDYTWSTTRLGLERTTELLERVGNPQRRLKFVHVAGTNGKGSTCAMIERILRAAGYRTGFYPSPFIEDFRERIQVNGEYITKEALARITERVALEADAMSDHPSQFELITAIGMLYFEEMHCDIVVMEVGMGGLLDSTNVIDAPEVAVITNIGLDHTEYLGDTLAKIAATKAGIIKPGTVAVSYRSDPEALDTIREDCASKNVELKVAGECEEISHSLDGQVFRYDGGEYRLSLLGRHQLMNAAVVLETINALRGRGYEISEEAVQTGLREVRWPVRFEVLRKSPLFILDGGHNPQCAEALVAGIKEYIVDAGISDKVTFLIGMLADKDYMTTLNILKPCGGNYVCITPDSHRALDAAALAIKIKDMYRSSGEPVPVAYASTIREAIETAAAGKFPVVAFGSLYSAGELRRTFRKLYGEHT